MAELPRAITRSRLHSNMQMRQPSPPQATLSTARMVTGPPPFLGYGLASIHNKHSH